MRAPHPIADTASDDPDGVTSPDGSTHPPHSVSSQRQRNSFVW